MDLFETAISQGIAPAIVVAIYLIVIKIIDTKKEKNAIKITNELLEAISKISNFLDNEEFKGFIWAVVDIDVSRYLGKAEKVNVTLPSRLIRMIDDKVGKDKLYKSRSAFLAAGAEKMLHTHL